MKRLTTAFLIVSFSFLNAGVRLLTEYESYPEKEKLTHTAYLEKDRLRVDIKGEKTDMSVIFKSDKERFFFLNHKNKSYTEITKEEIKRIKEKMEEGIKEMEKSLKNLPPEQRKMVEEMMKNKMKPEVPKITYKKVASEKINQWVCDKYEGWEKKEKREDLWVTDWSKIGLKAEDAKAFAEMAEFFAEMMKGSSLPFYQSGKEEKKGESFSGLPVRTIGYEKGEKRFWTELKEVKRETFKPEIFEIPKGYKKEKLGRKE